MAFILVTGSSGFIGSHLIRELRKLGHWTVGCDPRPADPNNCARLCINGSVSDYLDSSSQDHNTIIFDYIFHLGAIPRMGVGVAEPARVLSNNIDSTISVLEYARKNPSTRVIFTSSSSTKWSDYRNNPYTLSKLTGEQLVETYRQTYGVQAVTARLYNVFGPGETRYGENTTLLKQCRDSVRSATPISAYGSVREIFRDFTHVADVVGGLLAIMKAPDPSGLYEIGAADGSVSVMQIIEAHLGPAAPTMIKLCPARPWDTAQTRADSTLWPPGWKPTRGVLEYIYDWFVRDCPEE